MSNQQMKRERQEVVLRNYRFCGEQDGVPEGELKERLVEFFRRDRSITKAYLAIIAFNEPLVYGVALCLRTSFGCDVGMVDKISSIFASMFGRDEHLDIVFLDDEQERTLTKVCRPFFEQQEKEFSF